MPPPTTPAEQPAMQPRDFAQLKRVHHQRRVTVLGEPDALLQAIGRGLIAVAAVLVVMTDLIKDCGVTSAGRIGRLRKIEICRDVKPGQALEMKLLYCVSGLFNPPCDRRFERASFGHRFQPQHVEEIFAQRRTNPLVIGGPADPWQKLALEFSGARGEVLADALVSGKILRNDRRWRRRN